MDLGLLGRAATAATELRGRFLIVGLLRTAVGATVVLSLRIRRRGAAAAARGADNNNNEGAPAAMELEDGPRAAGASGHGGD